MYRARVNICCVIYYESALNVCKKENSEKNTPLDFPRNNTNTVYYIRRRKMSIIQFSVF